MASPETPRRAQRLVATGLPVAPGFFDARCVSTRRSPAAGRLHQSLEASLVLALFDLANHLQRRGERIALVAGLTTQQWLVLLQIAGDPNFPTSARISVAPVLASDIARVRGVSRATISAVVSALKKRGLVREQANPDDRRRRYLEVTRSGIDALESIEPDRHAANGRLLAALDQPERKRFLTYLHRCLDVLLEVREDEHLVAAKARLVRRTTGR